MRRMISALAALTVATPLGAQAPAEGPDLLDLLDWFTTEATCAEVTGAFVEEDLRTERDDAIIVLFMAHAHGQAAVSDRTASDVMSQMVLRCAAYPDDRFQVD